jgi:transcriptional regulator with XRE-family HTH domain
MASYGDFLRRTRNKGGWLRREVAAAAGIPEGAIRDYERGTRLPSFEAALRLAVAFGEGATWAMNHPDLTEGAGKLQAAARARRKRDIIRELRQELSTLRRQLHTASSEEILRINDAQRQADEALRARDAAIVEARDARQKAAQAEKARAEAEQALAQERRRRELEDKLQQGKGAKQPSAGAPVGLDDTLPWEKKPPAEPPAR